MMTCKKLIKFPRAESQSHFYTLLLLSTSHLDMADDKGSEVFSSTGSPDNRAVPMTSEFNKESLESTELFGEDAAAPSTSIIESLDSLGVKTMEQDDLERNVAAQVRFDGFQLVI